MNLRQKGLDYIQSFDLPKIELWPGQLLTSKDITDTFRLSIACERGRVRKGEVLGPLTSRCCGLPHMPEGIEWPKSSYLVAQLNLAEAAAFGLWEAFPSQGTAYLFFDPFATGDGPYSATAARVILADNVAPRTLREAPSDEELPGGGKYHREEYLDQTWTMTMRPIFSVGFGDLVPSALLKGLEAELGLPLRDERDGDIGGRPRTWQEEEPGDLFAPPDWDTMKMHPLGDRFLLFQNSFADGTAHFWVPGDALVSGKLGQVDMTYSGT